MNSSLKVVKQGLSALLLCLPLLGLSSAHAANVNCTAGSTCVTSGNVDSVLTKEQARQEKEQWDQTRQLRTKVNARTEKEFDKVDAAFDAKDACEKSLNLNAYWEPNTQRCLDVNTGRPLARP
ncbi:DUF1283 family protein [Providencia vermicola]|uniref:UPF0482 protein JRA39_001805 n=2 Tax=Providencia TaxID=586 RepID=A0AAI9HZR8_PROST|nr:MULTISPECIES: DUF1283 family protein [Providencia]ELR5043606.1 DUF1283 family protein [Providencia rettgeri]ELR5035613.1 DUF1283 family protein [Providencia stuartii]ELR5119895.1 DUF1283 family protein [Providencia stuartii]ELR5141643.1 DUF1283 family protein [Providencia stuartii]ELR5290997.1 DUF1283 family protein [Providencia stuartii]